MDRRPQPAGVCKRPRFGAPACDWPPISGAAANPPNRTLAVTPPSQFSGALDVWLAHTPAEPRRLSPPPAGCLDQSGGSPPLHPVTHAMEGFCSLRGSPPAHASARGRLLESARREQLSGKEGCPTDCLFVGWRPSNPRGLACVCWVCRKPTPTRPRGLIASYQPALSWTRVPACEQDSLPPFSNVLFWPSSNPHESQSRGVAVKLGSD